MLATLHPWPFPTIIPLDGVRHGEAGVVKVLPFENMKLFSYKVLTPLRLVSSH